MLNFISHDSLEKLQCHTKYTKDLEKMFFTFLVRLTYSISLKLPTVLMKNSASFFLVFIGDEATSTTDSISVSVDIPNKVCHDNRIRIFCIILFRMVCKVK